MCDVKQCIAHQQSLHPQNSHIDFELHSYLALMHNPGATLMVVLLNFCHVNLPPMASLESLGAALNALQCQHSKGKFWFLRQQKLVPSKGRLKDDKAYRSGD
jgi:hypothetical protein